MSGCYLFLNNINNKFYIGSSVNLYKRIRTYFHIINTGRCNLPLFRAMKKYGLHHFSFIILENCNKNVLECRRIEQKYFDLFNPQYNILKDAFSSFGLKHKLETIELIKKKQVV